MIYEEVNKELNFFIGKNIIDINKEIGVAQVHGMYTIENTYSRARNRYKEIAKAKSIEVYSSCS